MFNNKTSLQRDAHTMKSKESFTALLRDRIIPKAFSHRIFFFYPPLTLKQQSSFLLTYICILKIINCILRLLLSKDKYPICKLDFPQASLTMCHLEDSRDNHCSLHKKQLNTLPGADFKEIMTAISLQSNILFPLYQKDIPLFLFLSSSQWEKQ